MTYTCAFGDSHHPEHIYQKLAKNLITLLKKGEKKTKKTHELYVAKRPHDGAGNVQVRVYGAH